MECRIVVGNIAEQEVDAVVNSTDTELGVTGGVGVALFRGAGRDLIKEARSKAPAGLGAVKVTDGHNLPADHVLHAAVNPHQVSMDPTEEGIRKATRTALEMADELGCRSIAFPALGCGVGGFDLEEGARIMVEEITSFSPENLENVLMVAYDESKRNIMQRGKKTVMSS